MKDVEELRRKEKGEKKQEKKLRKKVKQFLRERKGKAYTRPEIKERLDLDEDLADLMDWASLTPISLYSTVFGVHKIESKSENSERYYHYEFDWSTLVMWFVWSVFGLYWIWLLIFQL